MKKSNENCIKYYPETTTTEFPSKDQNTQQDPMEEDECQ